MVLSAVPIAILTNAARVSGTGILAHFYGTQVADGFFHSFSGWIVYVVAFLLLFAVGWILDRIGGGGRGDDGGGKSVAGAVHEGKKEKTTAPAPVSAASAIEALPVKGAE